MVRVTVTRGLTQIGTFYLGLLYVPTYLAALVLQAFVFCLLTMIYIGMALEEAH